MWTTAVIVFMLGLISEQIAALRVERRADTFLTGPGEQKGD
jgi:hypothetical protein